MTCARPIRLATLIQRFAPIERSRRSSQQLMIRRNEVNSLRWSTPRHYNSLGSIPPGVAGSGLWIPHVVGILLALGVGATIWNSRDVTPSLAMWPPEVRDDLRIGLHAKSRGDLKLCQEHLARACRTLLSLPLESFSSNPYIKLSSLLIVLADVLEQDNQPSKAYWTYTLALVARHEGLRFMVFTETQIRNAFFKSGLFEDVTAESGSQSSTSTEGTFRFRVVPTTQNRLQLISLTLKLADMARPLNRPLSEEYGFLNTATCLAQMIAEINHEATSSATAESDEVSPKSECNTQDDLELPLPEWARTFHTSEGAAVDAVALAAPYERMGAFFTRLEHSEAAIIQFWRVIEFLRMFGGKDEASKAINMCRIAQMQNNCAEVLVRLHQRLQCTPITPSSETRFPPLPDISSTLNIPLMTLTINDVPLAPDNILTNALGLAVDAFMASSEFMVIVNKGMDSHGKRADVEDYGLCANVMIDSLHSLGIIYKMHGSRDQAREVFGKLLVFARGFSFEEGVKVAKAELTMMENEDRKERNGKIVKRGIDLGYDQIG